MTLGLTVPPLPPKNAGFCTADRRGLELSVYRCFQNYYHGQQLLGADPQYVPHVRLLINHWQIRDLVQVDETTREVLHTLEEKIRALAGLDYHHLRTFDKVALPYRPRCFHHAAGGLIVAGGVLTGGLQTLLLPALPAISLRSLPDLTLEFAGAPAPRHSRGLFSVHVPGADAPLSFSLGGAINNAVKVYSHLNAYTAYACNNDLGLYRLDISGARVCGDRRIVCEAGTALNNVHLDADGHIVTATGDSGTVFLVDPRLTRPVAQEIETAHDAGFGLSYHRNGRMFAVAFQDGTCLLYDVRRPHAPLHEVRSTRPGHQLGAFRTCRFLDAPGQDLLAVLEHLGRVHVVDTRDLAADSHQVMVVPAALDQFASGSGEDDTHAAVSIYNGQGAPFTAPLVYDHAYLADVNPSLFRGYTYEQEPESMLEHSDVVLEAAARVAAVGECVPDGPLDSAPQDARATGATVLYRQAVNHINGEMEIAGLDWLGTQLVVGCEDGGFLLWDVNVKARRSLGAFSYV